MTAKTFIDSSILAYSVDRYSSSKRKCATATIGSLLRKREGVISTQVIQESYVVAVKKLGIEPLRAKRWVTYLERFEVVAVDVELIREAIDCSILNTISFWDGLIVAAAERAGCKTLLSEDLNAGQSIRGIKIVNPFAKPPLKSP